MSLSPYLWGEDEFARRQDILQALSKYPLKTTCRNPYALSRKDLWGLRVRQNLELLELKQRLQWTDQHYLDALRIACPDVASLSANYRIFLKNLEAQMSPEQRAYWVPKARNFEISGCYAQTELGHGSNVKAIETTATFDPDTDEIVLNSPTLSSWKYWIGGLGVVATHALVVARLIVSGKDLGTHVFLVQVRDLQTRELMPGVQIYEQGEKSMGTFASMDNGVMKLTHKRIPRSQMLSGFVSLDRNGTYHKSPNPKHAYTSMVIIRGLMSQEIGQDVLKATIIAFRYANFRRQFNGEDGVESQVIRYQSVQSRLFPAMCRALAMMLVGRQVRRRVDQLRNNDPEDLHLQTVGIKVWVTERGVRDVEVARLLCGGHGNMAAAGLGSVYAQLSPTRTYEGDNYVLSQQIGKAIIKHWKRRSEATVPALSYLSRLRDSQKMRRRLGTRNPGDWVSPSIQEDALEHRACLLAQRHIEDTAAGRDTSYDVFPLTMAHADLTFFRALHRQLEHTPPQHEAELKALANVFSLTALVEGLEAFAGTDYVSQTDIKHLRTAQQDSVSAFSRHVDTLVDAMGFTEGELNSAFAQKDRNPYEALWEVARQSELNDSSFIRPTLLAANNMWKKNQGSQAKL